MQAITDRHCETVADQKRVLAGEDCHLDDSEPDVSAEVQAVHQKCLHSASPANQVALSEIKKKLVDQASLNF